MKIRKIKKSKAITKVITKEWNKAFIKDLNQDIPDMNISSEKMVVQLSPFKYMAADIDDNIVVLSDRKDKLKDRKKLIDNLFNGFKKDEPLEKVQASSVYGEMKNPEESEKPEFKAYVFAKPGGILTETIKVIPINELPLHVPFIIFQDNITGKQPVFICHSKNPNRGNIIHIADIYVTDQYCDELYTIDGYSISGLTGSTLSGSIDRSVKFKELKIIPLTQLSTILIRITSEPVSQEVIENQKLVNVFVKELIEIPEKYENETFSISIEEDKNGGDENETGK